MVSVITQTVPGIENERGSSGAAAALIVGQELAAGFPIAQWQEQVSRYADYWAWYIGTTLNATRGVSESGDPIYKFPLKMNEVRNFARKHAAVVLGEAPDGPQPMVKTIVSPKRPLDGQEDTSENTKKLAMLATNVVNEVWLESGGRALQIENAILQQFLGGCVFKLKWDPENQEKQIPINIEKVIPDFFLPVWNPKNFFDLLEVYEVYRIPAATARALYGTEPSGLFVMYVEHWTKTHVSIYVDGKPITVSRPGTMPITYRNHRHDWNFVPFVYIPSIRDASFYGQSSVEDIRGLLLEYNARMADTGDAIRASVHRRRYMRNVRHTPKEKYIGRGGWVIDLGQEEFNAKHPPEVWTEDPPKMDTAITQFATHDLWQQLLREGSLQNIAFGEDEGSQRSALTLAFRMWPTTSRARITRTFWNDGLVTLAKMILKVVAINKDLIKIEIPLDFAKLLSFSLDWAPMVPRDREQEVNEIVILHQSGLKSLESSLRDLGNVRDVEDEIKRIHEDLEFQSQLQVSQTAATESAKQGQGAKTDIPQPTVTTLEKE